MSDELDDYGFPRFEQNEFPLAYLLTFRTYGTWLHGEAKGSVRRNEGTGFGRPMITPSVPLRKAMAAETTTPMVFDDRQRKCVHGAILGVCETRNYLNRGMNVRRNHGHVVVTAATPPEKVVNEFKAYATRKLRKEGFIAADQRVWSRGASTRYLWKPAHVAAAIDYVLYCQEDIPFEFKD